MTMKTILVPVDDSIHSIHALQYLAKMKPVLQDIIYKLLYIQPRLSDYIVDEAKSDSVARKKLEQVNEKHAALGHENLERHKERLLRMNVAEESIMLFNRRRDVGVAQDILQFAYSDGVDAIAIGRRGYSKFQDTFIGSTTVNIVDHVKDIPVWVIDGEAASRNILFSVDGSVNSVKALDHLHDFLKQNPDLVLNLFHVHPSLQDCCEVDFTAAQDSEDLNTVGQIIERADRQCIENFMATAMGKIDKMKIHEDNLKTKSQAGKVSIGKAILAEFKENGYGTLVVGKRGIDKRFFMGSVSTYLLTHLENGALWIVP
jgi:nucleotide-binding universal stress UspA family protein